MSPDPRIAGVARDCLRDATGELRSACCAAIRRCAWTGHPKVPTRAASTTTCREESARGITGQVSRRDVTSRGGGGPARAGPRRGLRGAAPRLRGRHRRRTHARSLGAPRRRHRAGRVRAREGMECVVHPGNLLEHGRRPEVATKLAFASRRPGGPRCAHRARARLDAGADVRQVPRLARARAAATTATVSTTATRSGATPSPSTSIGGGRGEARRRERAVAQVPRPRRADAAGARAFGASPASRSFGRPGGHARPRRTDPWRS